MGVTSELYILPVDPFGTLPAGQTALEKHPDLKCRLALFTHVTNADQLVGQIQTGQVGGSLIKAELVLEPFQLLAAVNRAISSEKYGKMETKNLQTEIVYSLSPSRGIAESLKTFGIESTSTNILAVTTGENSASEMKKLGKLIKGNSVAISHLKDISDYNLIKQVYHVREPELNKGSILDSIVTRIVAKDYFSGGI